ncbi:lymphoid-specific helicase-like [Belonocnema kinseyi]|uniref:lymphoid-specific helicase-like n=1 Tax=Belonocnema kinseyi TaxID=2817044 RepID=UPI00143DB1E4|nr:lymphoid-specific helicase-like [Belonocnema kinseyi]
MENISEASVIQSNNPSPVLDITEDSGFSSISGSNTDFTDGKLVDLVPISEEDEIARALLEKEARKLERKRKREEEVALKQIADQEYDRELQEHRYKSLMHLLDQSQFYSNFIMKKIDDTADPKLEGAKKSGRPKANGNLLVSQQKSKKGAAKTKKEDLREYVSDDLKKKLQKKANLSDEEIEAALIDSSDDENVPPEEENQPFVHPKYFHGILHEYQQEGLQWLKVLYENGLNGILADEMGLGKTVQVIALMSHLIEKNQAGPFLIIAPLSTIPNWLLEFERFAPDLPVVLFHGTADDRRAVYRTIKHKTTVGSCRTQPIVLTTYEMPVMEKKFLRTQNWRYIVIDEGHRIKNHQCQLVQVLKSCKSMNRLLLTGTPLQNNLQELWSLLNFLLPEIFNDLEVFESWFDAKELQNEEGTKKFLKQEEEKRVLASLREILKPFMLRRVKDDVNLQIPAKKEVIVYAPITELQRDLYKAVLNRDIQVFTKVEESLILEDVNGSRPKRRCVLNNSRGFNDSACDFPPSSPSTSSPSPLRGDEDSEDKDWKVNATYDNKNLNKWKEYTTITESTCEYLVRMKFGNKSMLYKKIVSHPYLVYCPMDYSGLPKIDEDLVKASGKLLVLDKLLEKLKASGHKVLLFSTMTQILDMLEDYLSLRPDHLYLRLDGTTDIEDRKESISQFNSDPNIFLFLISTRAGGIGLNLASADTVIIYDSDWNPQADIQAMARCHRIGQTRPVVIYRLCSKGTFDEKIIQRAEAKRKLEKMVISKADFSFNLNNKETLIKLRELLESKECEVVSPDKDVFSEEELDKLLDRSDLHQ